MKKLTVFLCVCLFAVSIIAQTQQGFVKTLGRPNKPGVALQGVMIRMRGQMNQVLSGQDGRFSLVVRDKKEGDAIVLQSVRKAGYELKDQSMIGKQLVYSSRVPIEIVMVDLEQLARDKQRIEQKAYQVAEQNYQKKQKQLEGQLQSQQLTIEQYRQQLQQLQENFEKYQSLIGDMAERYARTDYDHLDSLDRVINICIENGELDKADSLIHTVFDPTTVLERNRSAKAEVRAKMELAQQIIDRANEDMEALRRDKDYALRVAALSENLAEEFLANGEKELAVDYLQKSLAIKRIIYGDDSAEVGAVQKKIETIK